MSYSAGGDRLTPFAFAAVVYLIALLPSIAVIAHLLPRARKLFMTISTRAIVTAAVVINIISIGFSEVQRRQLGSTAIDATLELRRIEQQRLAQQSIELDRTYKLVAEVNNRISMIQAQLLGLQARAQAVNDAK
ncbi:hypothetical protein ACVIHI_004009 [Bradyrhizobium sp. USDA 4524]|uniref:hypothetical protein n=1 Tax=unclassified Bradyrhizobium TaxID=2631580 RepID=UPI0020A01F43|nr:MULTISPECIES: hypothetical protein [unclassified Bradyrhizobium]MCP1843071.1 hypothetical protein [Bradyrhizobium sp. USDA 4538]MCP1850638.1 hypothetical protein [Bradyrhizobium sp. USDA 4541]MCP1903637.1 hypothetical protein [Bradyrhizobium sp. USDA 4537]MCP1990706.1 hypothetical protein [Bradyrhizobium sp. USDA 4539]